MARIDMGREKQEALAKLGWDTRCRRARPGTPQPVLNVDDSLEHVVVNLEDEV